MSDPHMARLRRLDRRLDECVRLIMATLYRETGDAIGSEKNAVHIRDEVTRQARLDACTATYVFPESAAVCLDLFESSIEDLERRAVDARESLASESGAPS